MTDLPEGYVPYNSKKPMRLCPACGGPTVRPEGVCIRCERSGISAQLLFETAIEEALTKERDAPPESV